MKISSKMNMLQVLCLLVFIGSGSSAKSEPSVTSRVVVADVENQKIIQELIRDQQNFLETLKANEPAPTVKGAMPTSSESLAILGGRQLIPGGWNNRQKDKPGGWNNESDAFFNKIKNQLLEIKQILDATSLNQEDIICANVVQDQSQHKLRSLITEFLFNINGKSGLPEFGKLRISEVQSKLLDCVIADENLIAVEDQSLFAAPQEIKKFFEVVNHN